jgi:hypothetical protein
MSSPAIEIRLELPTQRPRPRLNPHRVALSSAPGRIPIPAHPRGSAKEQLGALDTRATRLKTFRILRRYSFSR